MAGLRAILANGWGGIGKDINVSKCVYQISSVPHEWLFPRMSAVCHHGGAGTTAVGLVCGKPTLIVPFFGDQFWWAQRIQDLGVGISISSKSLTTEKLATALKRGESIPFVSYFFILYQF